MTKVCKKIWFRIALGRGWNNIKWNVMFKAFLHVRGRYQLEKIFSYVWITSPSMLLYWVKWYLESGSTVYGMKTMPRMYFLISQIVWKLPIRYSLVAWTNNHVDLHVMTLWNLMEHALVPVTGHDAWSLFSSN